MPLVTLGDVTSWNKNGVAGVGGGGRKNSKVTEEGEL